MVKQGSWLAEKNMHFDSDKNKYNQKSKSAKRKTDRKNEKQIINRAFDNE